MKRYIPSSGADFSPGDNSVGNSLGSKKNLYRWAIWILLIVSAYGLMRLSPLLTKSENLPSDDFIRFWASGRLNFHAENPYDPTRIVQIQIDAGSLASELSADSITLNPPWAVTLFMLFGLIAFPISRMIYLMISIWLILFSSQLLWRIYAGEPRLRWLAWLSVIIFGPTISVLEKGQITCLLLFGLVGFLYFTVIDHNDWLAGMAVALVSLKPQVVILFWFALLLWVIQQRRWLIPMSALITLASLTLIALIFNPHILKQYFTMLQTYQISAWAVPTIGTYLRYFWLGLDKFWLQFLPTLLGGIWLSYYWYTRHAAWEWSDTLPVVLLVSLLTSPYSWTYDLVALIPAILLAVVWMTSGWKHWLTFFLGIIFLGINLLDLFLHRSLDDFWFAWLTPALCIWFIIVQWQYPKIQGKRSISV